MFQDPILEVSDLQTSFFTNRGEIEAVRGISFNLKGGSSIGLVGESGCGKSVTALSIMRLVMPPGRIKGGVVIYKGRDILHLPLNEMRSLRGNEIAMIFQEPMTSLNPVLTIGSQITEAIRLHLGMGRKEALNKSVELLDLVGIPSPELRINEYPHKLSGGMRQRVMIAMALSCEPGLLIADEPTTALDVTIQAQILELISAMQDRFHMSVLLITHDMGVIAQVVDKVGVMYAGSIVEYTETPVLFNNPVHPYTIGLMESMPVLSGDKFGSIKRRLKAIPGHVKQYPVSYKGCRFADRCPLEGGECHEVEPMLREVAPGHLVACIKK